LREKKRKKCHLEIVLYGDPYEIYNGGLRWKQIFLKPWDKLQELAE
jgi:hypothetical protein